MIKVITNSDQELVNEIKAKIKENKGHCACAVIFNNDNKCMCAEFRNHIKNGILGECHCGLYAVVEE